MKPVPIKNNANLLAKGQPKNPPPVDLKNCSLFLLTYEYS